MQLLRSSTKAPRFDYCDEIEHLPDGYSGKSRQHAASADTLRISKAWKYGIGLTAEHRRRMHATTRGYVHDAAVRKDGNEAAGAGAAIIHAPVRDPEKDPGTRSGEFSRAEGRKNSVRVHLMPSNVPDPRFESVDPPISPGEIERVVESAFGLLGTAEPLSGERDQNFLLTLPNDVRFIVKVVHSGEEERVADMQVRLLLHVAQSAPELPTPRLRLALNGDAEHRLGHRGSVRRVRVMSFLGGRPLSQCPDSSLDTLENLGELVARLHRALQHFQHDADAASLVWDLQSAGSTAHWLGSVDDRRHRQLARDGLAWFLEAAEKPSSALAKQVIHNDLNPHNVLVSANRPGHVSGILDFGDAVRAPAINDIAIAACYQLARDDAPAAVAAILKGYRSVLPLGDQAAFLLPPLMAGRLAMTILITSWRAKRHPANAAYIRRNVPAAVAGLATLLDSGSRQLALALQGGPQ